MVDRGYDTAPTRQHDELDHTGKESIFPDRSRSCSRNRSVCRSWPMSHTRVSTARMRAIDAFTVRSGSARDCVSCPDECREGAAATNHSLACRRRMSVTFLAP